MPTVEINISGGSYKHKSLPLSAQRTINFWPQKQQEDSTLSPAILESFHGLKLLGTTTAGADRGMLEHRGVLYRVAGTKLFSVDVNGMHTELGTIAGSERCIMQGFINDVIVVTDGKAYQWDGSTVNLITDVDLETPNSCAFLNNQMIYDGDGARFGVSDVGDATSVDGLAYATAESRPDDLLRVYTFDQLLFLFGETSTEIWWNSGVGQPPFDRLEGGIFDIGLGAIHSVASTEEVIYFLGDDDQVHAMNGSSTQVVSTPAISREISKYGVVSEAHGRTINIDGQWLYIITFENGNKTFVFDQSSGEWFEWSSGVKQGKHVSSSYAFSFRKHIVADTRNGNLYILDPDTYQDNGEVIVRVRDTGVLHSRLFGIAGKDMQMDRFELVVETGVGLLGTGQGSDPVVMMQFSDDGGHTFSTENWGTVGKLGKFLWKVEWFNLGQFTTRVIRIKTSDPVYFSIHSTHADVEFCI